MASNITTKITISVKNGDVFDEMRLAKPNGEKGRSNTGTYFLCSTKDFVKYKDFFNNFKKYYFDVNKIKEYQVVFKAFYGDTKDKYLDQMINFDDYCNTLISSNTNITKMNFRVNDTRYFLRFEENSNELVKAFRHILYGEITNLVLELRENYCYIYPEIIQEENLFLE